MGKDACSGVVVSFDVDGGGFEFDVILVISDETAKGFLYIVTASCSPSLSLMAVDGCDETGGCCLNRGNIASY